MLGRLKGAVAFLAREVASFAAKANHMPQNETQRLDTTASHSREEQSLQEHMGFIKWYLEFLSKELFPTTSYQRHITALRAIQIAVDSGMLTLSTGNKLDYSIDSQSEWDGINDVFTEKMVRLLLDLLMDPFEDVRVAASQILKLAPATCFIQQHHRGSSDHLSRQLSPPTITDMLSQSNGESAHGINWQPTGSQNVKQAQIPEVLVPFIRRSDMASRRTGRADLADGVARTYELLYGLQVTDEARLNLLESIVLDLEHKVATAEDDLAQAVLHAPAHGQFAAIR
jgi:hypothetical protein